jgi:predicted Zn-dependent protease
VDATELHLKSGSLPDDKSDQLHEAVFKAFGEKNAPEYISSDRLAAIDEPLGTIAKARSMFYFGDKIQAQKILDQLKQNKPNMPEGQLLQAEFSAKASDSGLAHQAVKGLRANPRTTAWMLNEANSIERILP